MKPIHITVPASSANLGPGFDTLAVAVDLHNHFEFQLHDSKTTIEIVSGIDPVFHEPCREMILHAARYFFKKTGAPHNHFSLKVENHVPIARGLASSVTLRLAVLAGLNRALSVSLPDDEIVKLASELEVCTDNAAASFYGGIAASGIVNDRLVCHRFDVSNSLDFVAVWPVEAVETEKARETVFPETVPRADAVFSLNRAVLLSLAFASADYGNLAGLFDDRLHQTYRRERIPALNPLFDVISAAKEAGAVGGYLSGSGSTVMAVTTQYKEFVAEAMQAMFATYDMETEFRLLKADNRGLQVEI